MSIDHVSDTAHWVAMVRAVESERADALFHDPHARRLAGARAAAMGGELRAGESMAWALSVRTAVIDELVLSCVAEGAAGVLNLGAGLDTRAFRLPLPSTLRWFDVDLPGVVAHRRASLKHVQPACLHAHVVADLCDAHALDKVLRLARAGPGPLLVVSEGLLVYFEPEQVGVLAGRLHDEAAVRWWLADLVTPAALALVGARWPSKDAVAHAPFRFAPRDSAAFFEPWGWHEVAFRSIVDEALRLRRLPPPLVWCSAFGLPWWPGSREGLRRLSGVVLMQSVKQPTVQNPGPAAARAQASATDTASVHTDR